MELWRSIEGHEGYEVSSLGRVRSNKGILKEFIQDNGYAAVMLGAGVRKLVHRLVASAFIANPEGKPEVNHKDHVRHHNMAINLEWVTRQENIDHSNNITTFRLRNKITGEVVEGRNLAAFAKERGLLYPNLNKVNTGVRRSHKGWIKA
ncbi:hypothetical protein GRNsp03_240 [Salmonella phage GRNsp03]|uniref:NUMOD4 domain-containing protein n=1 Tax=Salmonella enterica TaxID=28901 RepID=UPI0020C3312A|nr:NUMOD4 domain-containing protein [Salmonella enterica]UUJ74848.1 hypothetical protein GRNsp03_240 [Salmonella phage GRNsp03]